MAASQTPVRLRITEFDRLTAYRGWDTDEKRCRALGISTAQMSKIRTGQSSPGAKFIAAALAAIDDAEYADLFERVATPEGEG